MDTNIGQGYPPLAMQPSGSALVQPIALPAQPARLAAVAAAGTGALVLCGAGSGGSSRHPAGGGSLGSLCCHVSAAVIVCVPASRRRVHREDGGSCCLHMYASSTLHYMYASSAIAHNGPMAPRVERSAHRAAACRWPLLRTPLAAACRLPAKLVTEDQRLAQRHGSEPMQWLIQGIPAHIQRALERSAYWGWGKRPEARRGR